MPYRYLLPIFSTLCACADKGDDTAAPADSANSADSAPVDTGPDPFADAVVDFSPGAGAGYGQDGYPDVVLGSPEGGGESGGLDVLSLGQEGSIILTFDDLGIVEVGPAVGAHAGTGALVVAWQPMPAATAGDTPNG